MHHEQILVTCPEPVHCLTRSTKHTSASPVDLFRQGKSDVGRPCGRRKDPRLRFRFLISDFEVLIVLSSSQHTKEQIFTNNTDEAPLENKAQETLRTPPTTRLL